MRQRLPLGDFEGEANASSRRRRRSAPFGGCASVSLMGYPPCEGATPKTALHRFLTEATWSAEQLNERRLEVMNKCSQTRISRGFSLIIDDSGHRKSGNLTAGVGRQYIGEIGKTDNGNVVVTNL